MVEAEKAADEKKTLQNETNSLKATVVELENKLAQARSSTPSYMEL